MQQPVIGLLDLSAVTDFLAEHAILIPQAVADRGNFEGRQRVQKTGGNLHFPIFRRRTHRVACRTPKDRRAIGLDRSCSMRVVTMRACLKSVQLFTLSAAIVAYGWEPAFAIPSPELVVGSLSSISQIVALAFATLGGGAALVGARVMSNRRAAAGRTRLLLGISVGALLALIASIGVNFYQYSSQQAALQERLEATLIRPTPLGPDGKPLDDLIREPAWTDQLDAPNGLTSDQLEEFIKAKQRGEHSDVAFYDIREASEIEMGTPPGASPLRFADISSGKVTLTTKKAVLVCHTGIRSYDMCQRLKAMGIDCQFMIGGIEKWITERRPLTGKRIRTLKDLRALPPYRNQAVLLDTPDVRRLLEKEDAIIVDPRLPGEFKATHLPNAINFTLRQTPQEKIPEQISLIPHKPVIIPCYDRRSCFYAEALGLEFARAGYDFRGRYTVPWDYFVKPPLKPFIKKWLDELNQTWWDKAVLFTSDWIGKASDYIGLLMSILLLAAMSRLIVLPFSVKAERDQIASRDLAAEVAAIKEKYGDNSRRRLREMRAFYVRHGLTPIRNMFGLLFLPLMALCVAAIEKAASQSGAGLLWLRQCRRARPRLRPSGGLRGTDLRVPAYGARKYMEAARPGLGVGRRGICGNWHAAECGRRYLHDRECCPPAGAASCHQRNIQSNFQGVADPTPRTQYRAALRRRRSGGMR